MRRRVKELSDKEQMETLDALYTAASAIQGRDAMKLFLRDLLTPSERVMLGRRIVIARRLLAGDGVTNIAADMKVGYDTIYRVERWLHDKLPGYEQAIKEMEKEFAGRLSGEKNGINKKRYATEAMYRLRKKYPAYFFLFPDKKGE